MNLGDKMHNITEEIKDKSYKELKQILAKYTRILNNLEERNELKTVEHFEVKREMYREIKQLIKREMNNEKFKEQMIQMYNREKGRTK